VTGHAAAINDAIEPRGALAWVRRYLPQGRTLPHAAWLARHRGLTSLLWLHVAGLPVFALASGYEVGHSLLEGGIVLVFALAYAAGWLVLRYTRFGRYVYAIGDNQEAARLMGLEVDRVLIGTYALSGALAGLAGVILAARLGAGQPVAGTGWELDAIAAAVVGGTLLTGGQGGAGSTLIGVLLLGVIFNLFNLEGTISPWWQWVLRGLFLLAVVVVQARLQQRAVRE
jgi:ribose/xylose/arabinose/galactoside ABC-type transport system permease subunit